MSQFPDNAPPALHPDILSLVDAVELHSPTRYAFRGELREVPAAPTLPPGVAWPGAAGDSAEGSALRQTLEMELYTRGYVRPSGTPVPADPMVQRDHGAALSAANNGRGTWESGWRIQGTDEDGMVGVIKDGITFWMAPAGLRTASGRIRPGDWCRVWVAKELRNLMPGFYFAIGNGDERDRRDAPEPLVRFYWHLTAEGAAAYMAEATSRLNALNVPFRTKVLSDPGAYVRSDAGVLYLERRLYPRVREVVLELHRAVASRLRPEVPMFTRALAPGLGLAEDPRGGMSFGQSRCRLVARGLWSGFTRGRTDREGRLAAVAEAFHEAGVDPAVPYLETGSPELYSAKPETVAATRPIHMNRRTRAQARKGRRA
ncbi:T3SS effector HopA1 family protein [Archangium gephyra]|nr:T3SS effector HopA1 family protein [Archangium gephyra]